MKKFLFAVLLISMAMTTPVFAQAQDKHALGNMYTKALNMIEACGMLSTLEPKKQVTITSITMDHGQVLVALARDSASTTIIYDPIANKILYPNGEPL